ncbi:MAG TPA: DUF4604 domain-containing protein [Allosphingosinicella sp.]|nr:DUF4604 domain-containing protein [Allosphingosinicella sp.]
MRWLLAALLLLTAACSSASAGGNEANPSLGPDRAAAGRYRLHEGPDVASGLELLPDGRFRYFLAAGALDARAEGRWSSDGRRVMLDTEPRPTPPVFSAGPVTRSDEAPLVVFVKGPDGRGLSSIDVRLGFTDGRIVEGYTQDYGWHYTEATPPGTPAWVELSLGMYGIAPRRFPLDAAAGNHFSFLLTPNDLGVVDFRAQLLDMTGRDLVMTRDGATSTYRREN